MKKNFASSKKSRIFAKLFKYKFINQQTHKQ